MKPKTEVHVISPEFATNKYNKVNKILIPQKKECIKIITQSGKELVCTKDHKILTNNGWKEAGECLGSFVIRDLVEKYGTYSEEEFKTFITIALITEGSCGGKGNFISFSNQD